VSSRPLRAGFIQPKLQGYGGLEKYGVHVIRLLAERTPVDVISDHQVDLKRVERAFGVYLDRPRFVCDPRCVSIEPAGNPWQQRVQRWKAVQGFAALTREYDLLISQNISIPYRCHSRRSVLLCHFPVIRNARIMPEVPLTGLRSYVASDSREQRDLRGRLGSWSRIVANSEFTRTWVKRYWDRETTVVNPPIDIPERPDLTRKKQWIIGAGFFSPPNGPEGDPWSYKRHEVLIDAFRALVDRGLTGWELHIAGHVLPPLDVAEKWVQSLRERAGSYPIHFHPNCPYSELAELFQSGSIFWHATGYGIDADRYPERTEHFGMVTAESMGWGCVPVVINMGGQPEIVEAGRSGLLWNSLEELQAQTLDLIRHPNRLAALGRAAVERAQYFGMERFDRQFSAVIEEEIAALQSGRIGPGAN
jgi:glycosyltransferase involved in cell wall biosynthesis